MLPFGSFGQASFANPRGRGGCLVLWGCLNVARNPPCGGGAVLGPSACRSSQFSLEKGHIFLPEVRTPPCYFFQAPKEGSAFRGSIPRIFFLECILCRLCTFVPISVALVVSALRFKDISVGCFFEPSFAKTCPSPLRSTCPTPFVCYNPICSSQQGLCSGLSSNALHSDPPVPFLLQ